MIRLEKKRFEEFSVSELYDVLALRSAVFIVEQNCPYQDIDGLDQQSNHVIAYQENEPVGYARIIPPGISYEKYAAIGRVISSKKVRGQQVGKQVFDLALKTCIELYPLSAIKLSAQVYIQQFYELFGFESVGESYLEDDIPHIGMVYNGHLVS